MTRRLAILALVLASSALADVRFDSSRGYCVDESGARSSRACDADEETYDCCNLAFKDMTDPELHLAGKSFRGANLHLTKIGGKDLRGARWDGASLTSTDLRGCDLRSRDARGASSLSKAASLVGARWDRKTLLLPMKFSEATGRGMVRADATRFDPVDLPELPASSRPSDVFSYSPYKGRCIKPSEPSLRGYNANCRVFESGECCLLAGKNLTGLSPDRRYDFSGADLRGSSFVGAPLRGANFKGAQLQGADFSLSSLAECYSVEGARFDSRTRLPEGLTLEALKARGAQVDY